ncbi:MAG: hypothetical protein GXX01_03910 [Clostridiales bacterium]|jgi:hypothetical protein|nr:hypothetical protein [Clostridiales bacterium]
MSRICPVCNGLYNKQVICSNCGALMDQAGRPEEYVEPYAPYMEKNTLLLNNALTAEDSYCIHLYACPECKRLESSAVHIISV